MIDYHVFNGTHLMRMQQQKLAELEAEHAKITMELRLAEVAGIENDSVEQARSQLAIVEVQHTAVVSWLGISAPDGDEESPTVGDDVDE